MPTEIAIFMVSFFVLIFCLGLSGQRFAAFLSFLALVAMILSADSYQADQINILREKLDARIRLLESRDFANGVCIESKEGD